LIELQKSLAGILKTYSFAFYDDFLMGGIIKSKANASNVESGYGSIACFALLIRGSFIVFN